MKKETPRTAAAPKIQPHPCGGFFVAVEHAEKLESELITAASTIVELAEQRGELQRLFDLQHSRVEAATALWREATGKHDVLPDLGALVQFLLDRITTLDKASREALAKLEKLKRLIDIMEADNDGKSEMEVALSSSFQEAVAYGMVEEQERQIEELKQQSGRQVQEIARLNNLLAFHNERERS